MGEVDDIEDTYEELVRDLDEPRKSYLAVGLPTQFGEDSLYVMRIVVSWGKPVTAENFTRIVNGIKTKARIQGLYSSDVVFK